MTKINNFSDVSELSGVTDVTRIASGAVVFFRQDAVEETIACLLSYGRRSEYTVTRYYDAGDDEKMMLFQRDPDGELDDWRSQPA